MVGVKTLKGRRVDPMILTSLTFDEALRLIKIKRRERTVWTGSGKWRSSL